MNTDFKIIGLTRFNDLPRFGIELESTASQACAITTRHLSCITAVQAIDKLISSASSEILPENYNIGKPGTYWNTLSMMKVG